ncbi:hypothetical protein [Nonomuraea cavernae]|uniref:hypothetical protein n=1 Tax=Nonomuraea cavernae TaxID=2045107 RepID=UPI0033F8866D
MSMPSRAPSRSRRLRLSAPAMVVTVGALLAGNVTQARGGTTGVISRWNNEPVHSTSVSPGFSMFLSSGAYTITAKLSAASQGSSTISYSCILSAQGGADTDVAPVTPAPNATQSVVLNVVHNFTSTGQPTFACTKPDGTSTVRMQQAKITAIKVNTLDNQPF